MPTLEVWDFGIDVKARDLQWWGAEDANLLMPLYCTPRSAWVARVRPHVIVWSYAQGLVEDCISMVRGGGAGTIIDAANECRVDWSCSEIVIVDWRKKKLSSEGATARARVHVFAAELHEHPSLQMRLMVSGHPLEQAGEVLARAVAVGPSSVRVPDDNLYVLQEDLAPSDRRMAMIRVYMCLQME